MATVTLGINTPSTTNASSYASAAFTPAVGDLLVAFVHASGTTTNPGTMTGTGAGLTFSWVTGAFNTAGANRHSLFVANQFVSAAASQTVTYACTGDAATGAIVHVMRIAGARLPGLGAFRQTATQNNGAAAGTPAPAFTSAAMTSNLCIGAVANSTSPATMTAPASWSELSDVTGYNTPTTGQEIVYRNTGETGTTITWGGTSASVFSAIIAEIDIQGFSEVVMPPPLPHFRRMI